ncbi:hypothetical protein FAZ79_00355 [Guyparkeria sp. SB14A]|uniref:phage regulatory CII family protein n=1 Tax=Guyparkeria sp. SB14A TaxID=2571147 RepID=UPI0010ABC7BB|nr:phage regulatory CII family protein [Guyparkeria sp. SB14A]TKA91791.1 hypothetical protein FAZ79_00355 [Guyparkeria sp. SB14A]
MPNFAYPEVDRAKWLVVHEYRNGDRRGARALAEDIGEGPGATVWCNKVNPALDSHHLAVNESIRAQLQAQDFRILKAEARVLGHVCIPIPSTLPCSDIEILNAYADWTADIGETAQAIKAALDAPRVVRQRLVDIRREIDEDFQRAAVLYSLLEQIEDDPHTAPVVGG